MQKIKFKKSAKSEVPKILAANALAAFGASKSTSVIRQKLLDLLRTERIFISRRDVSVSQLDGVKRPLKNAAELIRRLEVLSFSIVDAAEFSEEEKSYIFSLAKVIVLELGAGMTNLIFAGYGATAVFLCAPSLTDFEGQDMCDWPRDIFVPIFLEHLNIRPVVLREGKGSYSPVGFHDRDYNHPWELRNVNDTVSKIATLLPRSDGQLLT